jgi:hypothetical protein
MAHHTKDIALKCKVLTVVGPKAADVEKLAGKEVEATGVLKENDTQLDVNFVAEKKAAPAPAKPAAPAAKPATPAPKPAAPAAPAPAPAPAPAK